MGDKKIEQEFCLALENEKASGRFAVELATCLTPSAIITLSGEIGAGKTSIVRAALKHLGVTSPVKSPTFSLVETYYCKSPLDDLKIHHFDLYRVHQEDELEYIGFRDYFTEDSICFIEWPEHAGNLLPKVDIRLHLFMQGVGRRMQMIAASDLGKQLLSCLMRTW